MLEITELQISLLLKEGHMASASIGQGLTALRKAHNGNKGAYYEGFLLITSGIERLMKLIFINEYRGKNGSFPNNDDLKKLGHKISDLYSEVITYIDGKEEIILDPIQKEIVTFLTDFAVGSRYYNLDILTNRKVKYSDPLVQWSEIREKIKGKHIKSINNNETIASMMENVVIIGLYSENNELINTPLDYLNSLDNNDILQGYSVYYIHGILQNLYSVLNYIESKYHLYPYLTEFFDFYRKGTFKNYKIRSKRKWIKY